jgi:hypothetical protein
VTGPRSVANVTAEQEHPLELEIRRLRTRLDIVERQVQALADAGAALARGLQADPLDPPGEDRAGRAGRLAYELLLAAGLIGAARRTGTEEGTAESTEESADLREGRDGQKGA